MDVLSSKAALYFTLLSVSQSIMVWKIRFSRLLYEIECLFFMIILHTNEHLMHISIFLVRWFVWWLVTVKIFSLFMTTEHMLFKSPCPSIHLLLWMLSSLFIYWWVRCGNVLESNFLKQYPKIAGPLSVCMVVY